MGFCSNTYDVYCVKSLAFFLVRGTCCGISKMFSLLKNDMNDDLLGNSRLKTTFLTTLKLMKQILFNHQQRSFLS